MAGAAQSTRDEGTVGTDPPAGGPLAPLARAIQKDDMRRFGTRRTQGWARRFNRRHGQTALEHRRTAYATRFAALLAENGAPGRRLELRDGFAIDASGSLPFLDDAVAAGEALAEAHGGRRWEHEKPYLQNIAPPDAVDRHPALLDFITSSEIVAAVAPVFAAVPLLSGLLPRGVRLMESSTAFDPDAGGPPRGSQLFHLDYHSTPTVYVIVAVRDIGPDDGALHFLGKAASRRVTDALGYGRRGVPYRLTDEQVEAVVDPSEVHRFSAPAGTVLLLESSACLHFGSRRPATPRYQLQYAFTSPVRSDFLELWRPQIVYPVRRSDSELRRLVLDRALHA